METLISVIVPVYRTEKYLVNCIESIRKQTYTNLEIVLVDDGSDDESGKICDDFAKKDERIKVYHTENHGLSHARNYGIEHSTGDYIAFVDSDDMIHERFMQYLYDLCVQHKADIAQCDFLMIRSLADVLSPQKMEKVWEYSASEILAHSYEGFEAVRYIVAWNKLYKRSAIGTIRFPEGKLHEDAYTTHKIFHNVQKVVVSNQYMYWYLQRDDSIIGKKYDLSRLDSVEASREKMSFFKENDMPEDYYKMSMQHYFNLWQNYKLVESNVDGAEEVLHSLKAEIEDTEKQILAMDEGSLLEKMRAMYPYWDDEKKQHYESIYGSRIKILPSNTFKLPPEILHKYKKIAIYGAGSVGKAFYEQVKQSDSVTVSVWVDNLWNNYVKEGFDVHPVKDLWNADYEVVVIAVLNKATAQEIQTNLVSWGISENKIVWYYPDDRKNQLKSFEEGIKKIKKTDRRCMFLMNTADYGNLGDQAIAANCIAFLKHYFPDYQCEEISGRQWDHCKEEVKKLVSADDVLFIVGGGYMGDLWPLENNRVLEMLNSFPENTAIYFPQTFFFKNEQNMPSLVRKNTYYIHRDKASYSRFAESGNQFLKDGSALYPDMVLYDAVKEEKDPTTRKGILGCLRLDKEKRDYSLNTTIYDYCKEHEIPYRVCDTQLDHSIARADREKELEQMLSLFAGAKLVVTDRLHAMIFAYLTKTPCIALDNVSKKVSGVCVWIKDCTFIRMAERADQVIPLCDELLNSTEEKNEIHLKQTFDQMAADIMKWINR